MFKKDETKLYQDQVRNLHNLSAEELRAQNTQDLDMAISNLDGIPKKNSDFYSATPGGFLRALVYQNWVIVRQNEQIIQLLRNVNSFESANAPNTHNPASVNTSDTSGDDSRFFS